MNGHRSFKLWEKCVKQQLEHWPCCCVRSENIDFFFTAIFELFNFYFSLCLSTFFVLLYPGKGDDLRRSPISGAQERAAWWQHLGCELGHG